MALGMIVAAGYTVADAYAGASTSQTVTYDGISLVVPASWQVINLAASPSVCPRLDVHAVYLGAPGPHPSCPASGLGIKTEAVQIMAVVPHSPEELAATQAVTVGGAAAMTNPDSALTHTVTDVFPAYGTQVDLSYGSNQDLIGKIQSSMTVTAPAAPHALSRAAAVLPPSLPASDTQGIVQGKGFDTCSAPSLSTMNAWLASPFRSVGVYIGGADKACAQPNLTARWVSRVESKGWHVFPIYPGLQAPCVSAPGNATFSSTSAAPAGTASAADAAVQAKNLGMPTGTTLIYDMEAYNGCGGAVARFINAWDKELHIKGYSAGVYESFGNVYDLVRRNGQMAEPDVMYYADWDGQATTGSSYMPSSMWLHHQRIHQYLGNNNETYGGITLNIDNDALDANLGGGIRGSSLPSRPQTVIVDQSGVVRVYDRSAGGPLWEDHLTSGSPWAWQDMHGTWPSNPAAVVGPDGTVRVYAVGTNGHLYEKHLPPGGTWSQWWSMGGTWPWSPAAVTGADGTIRVFAVGTNGHLYERSLPPNGTWSQWSGTGDKNLKGTPAALADHNGGIHVYVRARSLTLREAYLAPGAPAWVWDNLHGTWPSNPAAVAGPDGTIRVYAVGTNGHLYEAHLPPGGTWSQWWSLASKTFEGVPSVVVDAGGTVHVFARAANLTLREAYLAPGAAWVWDNLHGTWPYDVAAAVDASGTVRVYGIGTNNRLYQIHQRSSGTWSQWVSLGLPS
jgi:glycoside hydrolase-like protein